MYENKYYIRLDNNNFVIKGFSDACEKPKKTDIYIGQGGRQFILNGMINPSLYNNGIPIYKYINNNIVELTDDDILDFKFNLPAQPPSNVSLQKQIYNLTTQLVDKGVL